MWGATEEEIRASYPCDGLLEPPSQQWFRAVTEPGVCRLVVKILAGVPDRLVGRARLRPLAWGDLVMMRRQLLTLRDLAQRQQMGHDADRACMAALLDWYQQRGVARVGLAASTDGEPLYRSLGFTHAQTPAMRLMLPPNS